MGTTTSLLREDALGIFLSEDGVFPSVDEREEFKLVSHRPTFLRAEHRTAPLHERHIADSLLACFGRPKTPKIQLPDALWASPYQGGLPCQPTLASSSSRNMAFKP